MNKRQAKKAGKSKNTKPKKRALSKRQQENLAAYRKERRRLTNYIARKRREGFEFGDWQLPEIPESPTKRDIERLKKLTTQKIMSKAGFLNKITGEVEYGDAKAVQRLRREFLEESRRTGQYILYDPMKEIGIAYDDYVYEDNVMAMKTMESLMTELRRINIPNTESRITKFVRKLLEHTELMDFTDALEKAAERGIRLNVNENYPDFVNAQIEAKYLRETLELSPFAFDDEYIYDMLQGYEESA